MLSTILEIVKRVLALIYDLKPTAFEKKEEAKKDVEGQEFWDKRNL